MTDLYSGHGWKVTLNNAELPDGRTKTDVRVHRADSAHLLAFFDDEHILMLREFRPFWGKYIWMLPSGKIDKEVDLMTGAQRELQEETGHKAAELKLLWSVNQSDTIDITNHIILAKGLTEAPLPQDADELIEVHTCTLEEALKNVESSAKIHTPSAYALRRWMMEHQ
jgi:ADP-ribose pyrophosphatase